MQAVKDLREKRGDVSKAGAAVAQPYQRLKEFAKYKDLVQRPAIAAKLKGERGKLAEALQQYVKVVSEMASKLDAVMDDGAKAPKNVSGKNLSLIANSLVYTSQLLHKLQQLQQTAAPLVSDTPQGQELEKLVEETVKDLADKKRKDLDAWKRDVKEALEDEDGDEPIAIKMTGKPMSFDKSGKLKVHYSERLVNLLREARQLCSIGCSIPREVEEQVSRAHDLYHSAAVLKQVAAFYNRIESEIIKSQMPMLIKDADEFEKVVQGGGKVITWADTAQVNRYMKDLKAAMDVLTRKNRRLRRAHEALSDIVVALMSVDLVRQRDKWKASLEEMKAIFKQVEDEGFVDGRAWRVHWDHQLFKALDYQYKLGLESCHETLPQLEAKLVFKGRKLGFDPPFEELRQNYYKELKKFINLPLIFKGVGDSDIFRSITERNAGELSKVFEQAEKLFKKLADFADSQAHWVALGTVDNLQEYVEEHISEVEDFEYNFRMLATRERDAAKLPDEKRIDCVSIDATSVKKTIEDLLKELQQALREALRKSASNDAEDLTKFVTASREVLAHEPNGVDEMKEASRKSAEIVEEKQAKKKLKAAMEEKCRLVRAQRGDAPDLDELNKMWDDLELRLDEHENTVRQQKEKLRGNVSGEIKQYQSELAKFASSWKGRKPDVTSFKDRRAEEEALGSLEELEEEWKVLKTKSERLKRDCAHFEMPEPQFPELESIQEEVESTMQSWALFQKYRGEMSELGKEPWLAVRERLFEVEDCLKKWVEEVRGKPIDAVVSYLLSDIQRLEKNVPFLKFVKGDGFTQDHWQDLFRLLNFPKGTDLKTATLQLFLEKSDIIVADLPKFKDLQARAVAEMTIREAFDELFKWGLEASFTLLEHKDCNGKTVPLIKEWKEILTQVGDHQSVLQAMRDSPYFVNFSDKAEEWDRKLSTLGMGLNDLNSVQRKWLYLEPIFGRGALPHEQSRFKRVDDDFRAVMFEIRSESMVVKFADIPRVCEKLTTMMDQLDRCQKALSDFLEQKRSKFPRFYFVGDDDLLEILGQSQNPSVIQAHLKKLFQAIFKVEFSEDMKTITAFRSLEGERVDLLSAVEISETVEEWLANLAVQMKATLEKELTDCLRSDKMELVLYPSMLLCAAEQVRFCQDADASIGRPRGLENLEESTRAKLATLTSLDLGDKAVEKLKLKAIILDVIHNVDVCQQLKSNQVQHRSDWFWHKQLRFYVNDTGPGVLVWFARHSLHSLLRAHTLTLTPFFDARHTSLCRRAMRGCEGWGLRAEG
jgi:dynein heavy chain 2